MLDSRLGVGGGQQGVGVSEGLARGCATIPRQRRDLRPGFLAQEPAWNGHALWTRRGGWVGPKGQRAEGQQ